MAPEHTPQNPLGPPEVPSETLAGPVEVWRAFHAGFQARGDRLIADYTTAWKDLRELLDQISELYRTLSPGADPARSFGSLRTLCSEEARMLLLDPLAAFHKKNPLARAVAAVQDYDAGVDDLLRTLPSEVHVTWNQLVEMAGPEARASWGGELRARWKEWRGDTLVRLRMRDVARRGVIGLGMRRLIADGDLQLVVAQGSVHLLPPWQAWRRQKLSVLTPARPDLESYEAEQQWWFRHAATLKQNAAGSLRACEELDAHGPADLSRRLLGIPAGSLRRAEPNEGVHARNHRGACIAYWARQQRAVESLLHLEVSLNQLASEATGEIARSLDWLEEEHRSLSEELDAVVAWLRLPPDQRTLDNFPPPDANLVSAEHRTRSFAGELETRARHRLPATIELVEPKHGLPAWRAPWKQLAPAEVFQDFLNDDGIPAARSGFAEAEAAHQPIVREIERSREVVAFGLEEGRKDDASPGIAEEAAANALALLEYQQANQPDTVAATERHLCQALAVTLLDTELAVERSWLGVWAHLTRQSSTRAARELAKVGLAGMGTLIRWSAKTARQATRRLLVTTGFTPPPPAARKPVENLVPLGEVLDLRPGERDLPAIYQRLFRLAPVEDPRFLVGREQEMAGLLDAKTRWQAGAAVAVMMIGSRGSGKTSLLNCAAARIFTDVPVVAGKFPGRLTSIADMHDFLREFLNLDPSGDIVATLSEGRRVIMLEEFERIFLRRMGGFAALDEFLRILDATAASNLWIVSMNHAAFRYLSATTRIAECFSTRINAASVGQAAMLDAILQRHNLSGYRLHFEPPPNHAITAESTGPIRRLLGLEPDRQERFFSSLYDQSEGIFRSAFELWQDSIERVEGGVVHARQPLNPDYKPLMRQLATQDHFLLLAVMQHGSLTTGELAQVLLIDPDLAQRRLRRMQDLEVLEPEPGADGLRIRPQAARFVREALHSSNLLPGGTL